MAARVESYCTCLTHRQKEGFTYVNGWWPRPSCGKVTRAFLEKTLERINAVPETRLNLFQNGDHHNELWTNQELLYGKDSGEKAYWITDYTWTADTITGSESGRVARIWVLAKSL
jgi:hypothetical protein